MNPSSQTRTMLVVLAHPDDESFGMGGTIALYTQRGVHVHYLCATGGEAGSYDPEMLDGYTSIAERRKAELECAAEKLGLAGLHMLGYRDSGMPDTPDNDHPDALINAPREIVAKKIAGYIRMIRPDVVVTHDPIGGYKHPDHIAVHHAAVLAFDMAGDGAVTVADDLLPHKPAKLYYTTFPKLFLRIAVLISRLFFRNPRKFGRNKDIDLVSLVEDGNFPIHARINYRSVVHIRDEASACHASQLPSGPPNRGLLSMILRLIGGTDTYMRVIPPPEKGLREKDLFAGL